MNWGISGRSARCVGFRRQLVMKGWFVMSRTGRRHHNDRLGALALLAASLLVAAAQQPLTAAEQDPPGERDARIGHRRLSPAPAAPLRRRRRPTRAGYWIVGIDGGIYAYGCRRLQGLDRGAQAQQADGRHGAHPQRPGLLARRLRRRHLLLRRRQLPGLDRRHAAQQADRRHGLDAQRQGLLAGGLRRRDLRLRRRRLPRVDRGHPAQQADRRHGADAAPARATGWWPRTAGSSPSATPPSPAPPAT